MSGGIILNPGCQSRCVFCGHCPKRSFVVQKWQFFKAAMNLAQFKRQGITDIEISGSDPIEHRDIIDTVKAIKRHGFNRIQLSTHGRRLADQKFAASLIDTGVDEFRIPVYGSTEEIHDSVTRSEGSFDDVIKGIKNAKSAKITISSLIVRQNLKDLKQIIDLARSLDVDRFYFSIPCLANTDPPDYYVPLKELPRYLKPLYEYSKKSDFPVFFHEIPFCLFGALDRHIDNKCAPPKLGNFCQPPKHLRSNIKDLPSYRIKQKIDICQKCKASQYCDGFFKNDIDRFGPPDVKPI